MALKKSAQVFSWIFLHVEITTKSIMTNLRRFKKSFKEEILGFLRIKLGIQENLQNVINITYNQQVPLFLQII